MPDGIGDGHYFYHRYALSRDLRGADPACVFRKLVEEPTPGQPKAATPEGTPNDATVTGFDYNPVTSYLTQRHGSGAPLIVNIAGVGNGTYFGPGTDLSGDRDMSLDSWKEGKRIRLAKVPIGNKQQIHGLWSTFRALGTNSFGVKILNKR